MRIFIALKKLFIDLYRSIKRFPLSIAFSTAGIILLIVLNHNDRNLSDATRDILRRITMVLMLGIPVSLCIKLIFERSEKSVPLAKAVSYLIMAAALVLYYLLLLKDFKMVPVTRYIALTTALYLAFAFIPYLLRRENFELYVIKLFSRFFITIIYSVILFLGTAAILFTIDKLLGVKIEGRVYFDIWLCSIGIFGTSFFLAGIPQYKDQFDITYFPKMLKILLLYIVMPLILAYTAILYIYFIKVIVTWKWPSGMVAHLVLWYSAISTFVLFLISPLVHENKWAKASLFWLPKLILLHIALMFVSIGIRVNAYGITENRYFVIVLGLWALGMMIYLNLSKNRNNILMSITLSLIAILSVTGPWSSYSVSKFSQNKRFENILSRNNMISGNTIVKPKKAISENDKKEISEILKYFSNSHQLQDVKLLPEDFKLDNMESLFGFTYYYTGRGDFDKSTYFAYNSGAPGSVVDISGYGHMLFIRSYESSTTPIDSSHKVIFNNNNLEVTLAYDNKEVYKKSLKEIAQQVRNKLDKNEKYNLNYDEASFTDENEAVKVKYIIQNLNGSENRTTGESTIHSMELFMLIDVK